MSPAFQPLPAPTSNTRCPGSIWRSSSMYSTHAGTEMVAITSSPSVLAIARLSLR